METLLGFVRRAWEFIEGGWEFVRALWKRFTDLVLGPEPAPILVETTQPAKADNPPPLPDDTSDEMALARMLSSEDRSREVKIVIGWITVQKQRGKQGKLYQLLTKGLGYGKQDRRDTSQGIMYASTAKPASASDLKLARGLLAGTILPSAQIRAHKPGGWVERGQGTTDDRIITLQKDWNEGIYAKLEGSRWVLYSSDTKKIAIEAGATSKTALDQLPSVPALDAAQQTALTEALA